MERSEVEGTVTAFSSTPMLSEGMISVQVEPDIDMDALYGLYDDAFSGVEELAPVEEESE